MRAGGEARCQPPPVLPSTTIAHTMLQETAALRDFEPA